MLPIQAIVVETNDPEQLGRVMVASPEMGDYWPLWAPVVEGTVGTLSIDDLVGIAFFGGDPTRPVVPGRLARP